MAQLNLRRRREDDPAALAIEASGHATSGGSGQFTAAISALALVFSGYSLWDSSLKGPEVKIFVPPVTQYSSPYQNSNFEVIEVPMTILNDGGRTGTILSMELQATNPKTKETKHFYAADFGRWTMDKARAGFEHFAPIPIAGKASRTQTVLFYPKSPAEKPDQLIHEPGVYQFKLIADEARPNEFGFLDRIWPSKPAQVNFSSELRFYDARSFQNGTIAMYSTTGQSAKSDDENAR
ncbi:hypothetical protein [Hyphomicrobium sp.]|jgi:hypothetical protein|uniref:hypothetical protein n=1 Tax=Hyphomicrobium sp. TaxID=82 RepID=UPI002CEE8DDB|nr:hypothetical protein [Hyphomicrobium sp.]HVZ04753.1 hypothetical protein [Hyphomicrobium sp.]